MASRRSKDLCSLSASKTFFRSDIEGLRGIAVLAVVLHHLGLNLLPHGYLGVDVFYVISGYVITGSISKWDWTSLRSNAARFFARRFKRLAPALFVCLIISSAVSSLFIRDMGDYLETAIWASFGISNIFLFKQELDYFGSLLELNPFTHTWSLGVEEQFYLIFPLLAWLILSKRFQDPIRKLIVPAVVGISLLSLCSYVFIAPSNPQAAFYLLPFRAWELAAGSAMFVISNRWAVSGRSPLAPIAFGLLILVFAAPSNYDRTLLTIFAVILTSLTVLSAWKNRMLANILDWRPLREVGRISYSLYLWHWPVVVIAKWTIGITMELAPILGLIMLTLAKLSFELVEQPMRYVSWSKSRLGAVLKGSGGVLVAVAILSLMGGPLKGALYSGRSPQLEHKGLKSLLTPLQSAQSGGWAGAPCVLSDESKIGYHIPIDLCTFGDWDTAERRILVVGNSFSAAFSGAFQAIADRRGWAILLTSSWGAPPIPDLGFHGSWEPANRYYWQEAVPGLVYQLREGDLVFLVSDLVRPSSGVVNSNAKIADVFIKGLRRYSAELKQNGLELAILGPLPFVREAKCKPDVAVSQWFAPSGAPCNLYTRVVTLRRLAPLRSILSTLQEEEIVKVVDLFDFFCAGPICDYGSSDGLVFYRDEWSHPSLEAARATADSIASQLD